MLEKIEKKVNTSRGGSDIFRRIAMLQQDMKNVETKHTEDVKKIKKQRRATDVNMDQVRCFIIRI